MIGSQLNLTQRQINCIDDFLVYGTQQAIEALEVMFGLPIDDSESTIEIATVRSSHNLHFLINEGLHIVSSAMSGELQGHIVLLMRASDYRRWCEVMRPVLALLYLSSTDEDLATLDRGKPSWMEDADADSKEESFQAAMRDALNEMGNVLFGIYTRAISKTLRLEAFHSVPRCTLSPGGRIVMEDTSNTDTLDQLQLVIQNDFHVMDQDLRIWCLISPTRDSFHHMMDTIDRPQEESSPGPAMQFAGAV